MVHRKPYTKEPAYCSEMYKKGVADFFTGIINISGERPVSHYDFNKFLARLMNIDDNFLKPNYKEEVYHNLNNDKRKSMLNTIVRDIGFVL